MTRSVIALVNDMMFESKMRAVAQGAGASLSIARTNAKLAELVAATEGALILVDLNCEDADPVAAVRATKAAPGSPHVVAFLSHAQVDLAEAAKVAGADEVLARSRFVQRLPELMGAP